MDNPWTVDFSILPDVSEYNAETKNKIRRSHGMDEKDKIYQDMVRSYEFRIPIDLNNSSVGIKEGTEMCFDSYEDAESYVMSDFKTQAEDVFSNPDKYLTRSINKMGKTGYDQIKEIVL